MAHRWLTKQHNVIQIWNRLAKSATCFTRRWTETIHFPRDIDESQNFAVDNMIERCIHSSSYTLCVSTVLVLSLFHSLTKIDDFEFQILWAKFARLAGNLALLHLADE